MSWSDNGPTDPPQGRPDGHQPPRWAWWVVGIVIPVVGIVITIMVSGSGSSDDKGAERDRPPVGSSVSTKSPEERPAESAAAAEIRYGPVAFEVDLSAGGMRYVDLDSTEPVVMTGDAKSKDFTVTTTGAAPTLSSRSNILAQLPASGPTPTEAQCAKAVTDGGTDRIEAARGSRFCLTTTDGGTAYLNVVSAPPGRGIAKFTATVWQTPAA